MLLGGGNFEGGPKFSNNQKFLGVKNFPKNKIFKVNFDHSGVPKPNFFKTPSQILTQIRLEIIPNDQNSQEKQELVPNGSQTTSNASQIKENLDFDAKMF